MSTPMSMRSSAELRYFRSDFFKIVLKDVITPPAVPGEQAVTLKPQDKPVARAQKTEDRSSNSNHPEFFIHKALLSTLSAELFKHANNEMKEGREGVLELSEVDEGTMEAFLEWAYYKDYSVPQPKRCSALLTHTKTYVFADRFNVQSLKNLGYSKLTALLSELGMIADQSDVATMMEAIEYAYDNLLLRTTPGKKTSADINSAITSMEKLLRYFAQYTAWALDVFRGNEVFRKLMATSADFSEAFVLSSRPAASPPWVLQILSPGSTSSTTVDSQLVLNRDDKNHLLYRRCLTCSYIGVMNIQCTSCARFDFDIGTTVRIYSSDIGTVDNTRLSGTKQNFTYTCKWCNVKSTYGSTTGSFYQQGYGNRSFPYYNGYLTCRKCNTQGNLAIQN